jgi:hypothetical protein
VRRRFAKAGRVRRVAGTMNGLERDYSEVLNAEKAAGEIIEWWYERLTFTVALPQHAKPARLTPDFFVVNKDHECEVRETKGGLFRDDAKVKLKALSEQYPFKVVLVTREALKRGGAWKLEDY